VDRSQIVAAMEAFADRDDARRRRLRTVPEAVELSFGLDGAPPVEVPVAERRAIRLRGRIDRVDRTGDGGLVVTDYKTGRPDPYRKLTEDDPLGEHTRLQLPLYALAARQVLGEPDAPVQALYWFTSAAGDFEECGYDVTSEVMATVQRALRTALDGMSTGLFPPRPEPPVWRLQVACHYCDPDGLGTAERYRRWKRVRAHEDLRDYLRLVEPEVAAALDQARADGEAPS
jgi:ATP-dependent helicase/nuclease subunit B